MRANHDGLKQDLHQGIDDLKTLSKVIRRDLRAARSDARRQWRHFVEPQLANLDRLTQEISAASRDAVKRTGIALNAFQASIKSASVNGTTTSTNTRRKPRRGAPAKQAD